MLENKFIETPHLLLRQWRESDFKEFARMNADQEVMRYFPEPLTAEQTKRFYDAIQREFSEYNYGLFAAQEKESGSFTAVENLPSQRVMKKIGMKFHCFFEHPKVPQGHFLRPHVCYIIERE